MRRRSPWGSTPRRKRYTPEFKAEAIRLVQTSDRPVTEIAAHLGVTAKSLHEWIAAVRPAPPTRLTSDERTELQALRRECATADGARHPKKSHGLLRPGEQLSFRFIAAEKATYPVWALCRALDVSPSGYYAWRGRPLSPRAQTDIGLGHAIRVAHATSGGRYGSPRVHRAVRAEGHPVGRRRVIRLMRAAGLRARPHRRFRVTTDSRHAFAVPADLVQRQFRPAAPNQVWAADITYLDTADGWLYLAVILDLFSRRVIGWAVRRTLHTDVVNAALHLALGRRHPAPGLIHHSDRGVQYASGEYQRLLARQGIVPSMSRRGDCWDNAVVESFFSTLKHELDPRGWRTEAAATAALATYIDGFYNPVRLHSTLDYQPPNVFEAAV